MTCGMTFRALSLTLAIWTIATISAAAQPATHTVTDMTGATVVVPVKVERIAQQFPAQTVTVIMLGAGDKLVAIPQNVKTIPLMQKIYPRITELPEAFPSSGPVNIEDLMTLEPDVVIMFAGANVAPQLETAGIPGVVLQFYNFEEFARSVTLAGEILGDEAAERASAFNEYVAGRLEMVTSRTASLTPEQRPSVVHISSFDPLAIDGNDTIMQEWIEIGGGTPGAVGASGTFQQINFEQLLQWDPDVIVVQQTASSRDGMRAGSARSVIDELIQTAGWSDLKAVREGRVHINPRGMYPWERYTPEEAMQIQWIAKTLHPALFEDLDIRAETASFYRTFFGYELSEAELDEILQVRQ